MGQVIFFSESVGQRQEPGLWWGQGCKQLLLTPASQEPGTRAWEMCSPQQGQTPSPGNFFFFSANNGLPALETQAEVLGSLACAHLPPRPHSCYQLVFHLWVILHLEIFDLLDENTID